MTYTEQLEQRALDALVEMMMDGKRYPSRTDRFGIRLVNVLNDCEPSDLVTAIVEFTGTQDAGDFMKELRQIVAGYLEHTNWHREMQDTLREDDEAAAMESAMESKRAAGQSSTACDDQFLRGKE